MQSLLQPDRPSSAVAAARCRAALGRRFRGSGTALRWAGRGEGDELVALTAWFETLRWLDEEGHGLDEARAVTEEIQERSARSALAVALEPVVLHRRLSLLELLAPAAERARSRGVFDSRADLTRYARRLVEPEVRALLGVLALEDERSFLLARSLAVGVQVARWLDALVRDVERGRIHLPMDEVARVGLSPLDLGRALVAKEDLRMRRVLAGEIEFARSQLSKGWPLTRELDWARGRLLAFALRWHAATLSALESSGYRVRREGMPAGVLRALACSVAALGPRRAPFGPQGV